MSLSRHSNPPQNAAVILLSSKTKKEPVSTSEQCVGGNHKPQAVNEATLRREEDAEGEAAAPEASSKVFEVAI